MAPGSGAAGDGGLSGSEQPEPDRSGPLIGYRMWWGDDRGNLLSLNTRKPWDAGGWTRAWCFVNPLTAYRDVPGEGCSCGLYAYKSLAMVSRALIDLPGLPADDPAVGVVGGAVELAGRVIEHDLGYRAELARTRRVHPVYGFEWVAAAAADRLGVPSGKTCEPSADIIEQVREQLRRLHGPRPLD